jgi:hypothetical protein
VDGDTHKIPAGTMIDPHGYYLITEIQLNNSGGLMGLILTAMVTGTWGRDPTFGVAA